MLDVGLINKNVIVVNIINCKKKRKSHTFCAGTRKCSDSHYNLFAGKDDLTNADQMNAKYMHRNRWFMLYHSLDCTYAVTNFQGQTCE